MGKIKLLFIAEELQINGAMISLISLLKALPKDKYDITLFLFLPEGSMIKDIPDYVNILPPCLPYMAHRMPMKTAIKTMLRKGRLDIVMYRLLVSIQRYFGLNYRLWGFLPDVPGEYDVACCYNDGFVAPMMIRKVNAKRKVAWIHTTYSNWAQGNNVYDALKRCDLCVPVSIAAGEDLDRVIGIGLKKHVIHNIIDASNCRTLATEKIEIPRTEGKFRIVTVGRITSPKNVEIIIPTAQLLKNKGVPFEWYIIGNGDLYDKLTALTDRMGLSEDVHFIGVRANAMPWIKSADVVVNPSKFEAWGMTVSEALCLGKAVIASDIPVFAEQITNGVNGLMCEATPDNLASAIMRVLSAPEFKKRLESNAVNYKFTKECIIDEFNQMIESLDL